MTQTLTTDRMHEIAEDGFLEHGDAKALAAEILANREAQPVGYTSAAELDLLSHGQAALIHKDAETTTFIEEKYRDVVPLFTYAPAVASGENCWSCGKFFTYAQHSECDGYCPHCNAPVDLDEGGLKMKANDWQDTIAMAASAIEDLLETADEQAGCWADVPARLRALTAPPAPAVPTTVNFSENSDADMCRTWAWERVKEMVTTDSWDAGDSANFFAFFCWGWDMRRQYNEQRPPVVNPAFTGATAVPDISALTDLIVDAPAVNAALCSFYEDATNDNAFFLVRAIMEACRAAMLAAAPEGGNGA